MARTNVSEWSSTTWSNIAEWSSDTRNNDTISRLIETVGVYLIDTDNSRLTEHTLLQRTNVW